MKKSLILIILLVLTSSCEIKLEEECSGWLIKKKYRSLLLGPSFVISNPTDIENWKIIIVQEYTYQKYNIGDTIK